MKAKTLEQVKRECAKRGMTLIDPEKWTYVDVDGDDPYWRGPGTNAKGETYMLEACEDGLFEDGLFGAEDGDQWCMIEIPLLNTAGSVSLPEEDYEMWFSEAEYAAYIAGELSLPEGDYEL